MDTYPCLDVNICKQCTILFSGNMQESVQVVNFYFNMCTGSVQKYVCNECASCILLVSQTWKLPWKLSSFHKWFPTCALGVYTCIPLEHVHAQCSFQTVHYTLLCCVIGLEGLNTASLNPTCTWPEYQEPSKLFGILTTRTTLGINKNLVKSWSPTTNVSFMETITSLPRSTAATGKPSSPTFTRCLSSIDMKRVLFPYLMANSRR